MSRMVIYLPAIRWTSPDGEDWHGGWVVVEGRGCVYNVIAGPFVTREAAEAEL